MANGRRRRNQLSPVFDDLTRHLRARDVPGPDWPGPARPGPAHNVEQWRHTRRWQCITAVRSWCWANSV